MKDKLKAEMIAKSLTDAGQPTVAVKFPKRIIIRGEEIDKEMFINVMADIFEGNHNRKPTLQELAMDINDFLDNWAEFEMWSTEGSRDL